jgi:hypothetical protein
VIERSMAKTIGGWLVHLFIAASVLFMSGCGSQSSVTTNLINSNTENFGPIYFVPVSLTVTDAPPAGVTVLFFQLAAPKAR